MLPAALATIPIFNFLLWLLPEGICNWLATVEICIPTIVTSNLFLLLLLLMLLPLAALAAALLLPVTGSPMSALLSQIQAMKFTSDRLLLLLLPPPAASSRCLQAFPKRLLNTYIVPVWLPRNLMSYQKWSHFSRLTCCSCCAAFSCCSLLLQCAQAFATGWQPM
jgi:hypothetical protein